MSEPASARQTLERLGTPPEVVKALADLRDHLAVAAGANLRGLIVYGSVASGGYRADTSDVNVVVLLEDTTSISLAAIAPALRTAWRAAAVEPFLLTLSEVPRIADVFPIKILDIQAHHVVLCGEDPFVDIEVDREHIRLRLEQELRNLGLRLRRRYLSMADDPAVLAATLAESARPLAVNLASLLRLSGKDVPTHGDMHALFEAAARAFDLDRHALTQVAALHAGSERTDDLPALHDQVLATIDRLIRVVDTMETS